MLSGYTYEGGAHGNPYRSCLTFDSETGNVDISYDDGK